MAERDDELDQKRLDKARKEIGQGRLKYAKEEADELIMQNLFDIVLRRSSLMH
jgi:hypothetical protein